VQSVGLASYHFTSNITNINENNRRAVIVTATQSFPVTIAAGQYDEVQLAAAVQNAILSALLLATVTVIFANSIYTITTNVPFYIKTNPFNGGLDDFFDMMGLLKEQPLSNNLISLNVVNLVFTDAVYITSEVLNLNRSKVDYNTNDRTNNVGVMYLDSDKGNKNYERISDIKYIPYTSNRTIDYIDITLYDDRGSLLPSNNFKYLLEFYTL
jgi:hypothetical protein